MRTEAVATWILVVQNLGLIVTVWCVADTCSYISSGMCIANLSTYLSVLMQVVQRMFSLDLTIEEEMYTKLKGN